MKRVTRSKYRKKPVFGMRRYEEVKSPTKKRVFKSRNLNNWEKSKKLILAKLKFKLNKAEINRIIIDKLIQKTYLVENKNIKIIARRGNILRLNGRDNINIHGDIVNVIPINKLRILF